MYVPLTRFLLRAPLLPLRSFLAGDAGRAIVRHPLGRSAIALASPSLAEARRGRARDRAVDRYGRRAAFRTTPHGLLAGVCVGTLARRTEIATGPVEAPRAHLAPRWTDVDALARELLDDREIRERTRLRLTASALAGASRVTWIAGVGALSEGFGEERSVVIDARLATLLDVTDGWTPWPAVRARISQSSATSGAVAEDDDCGDPDDYLLLLVDEGLLEHDLAPPLVGPPPIEHVCERLAANKSPPELLERARQLQNRHATLLHQPQRSPTLERAAVERAAALTPLVMRLQEALMPPMDERFASAALADGLDGLTELFGSGAFPLGPLGTGDYGVELRNGAPGDASDEDDAGGGAPNAEVLAMVIEAIVRAARENVAAAPLDVDRLAEALSLPHSIALPPTAELFLVPTPRSRRRAKGAAPGTGWLLGLHAPGGASLGRFAHALGPGLDAALAELAAAERRALAPGEEPVDVGFAPSGALADLSTHPPLRRRTLAITRFGAADDDLALRDLELVADPGAPAALALRARSREEGGDADAIISPSPLTRVRSATAPPGIAQLLVGWSLRRQHAPWALPLRNLRALASLDHIPRLTLDGFVVAPASWRVPAAIQSEGATRTDLARWRRNRGLPRFVQVGDGDELLPVDLASAGALGDLRGRGIVHEIWPPLDPTADRDGRRVEAVVLLVADPDPSQAEGRDRVVVGARRAGTVPPPAAASARSATANWRTFKLYGSAGDQDEVLREVVYPTVRSAREAREIDAWFFLRYLDPPGQRHHLRVRVHAPESWLPFAARMAEAVSASRDAATVTAVEITEYHPEHGRFVGDAELDAAHAVFEADSAQAIGALDSADTDDELLVAVVAALDQLAAGLGLDLDERHTLARARRSAAEAELPPRADLRDERRAETDALYRRLGRALHAALRDPRSMDAGSRALLARARAGLTASARDRLLPTFVHLGVVRRLGADRDAERVTYVLWERALEGLRKREASRNPGGATNPRNRLC